MLWRLWGPLTWLYYRGWPAYRVMYHHRYNVRQYSYYFTYRFHGRTNLCILPSLEEVPALVSPALTQASIASLTPAPVKALVS